MSKTKKIKLRDGLYYDPVFDSYFFTTDHPEELGFISLGLQVTRRCNASCIHCAASKMTPEVGTKKMLEIIDKLHQGGCVRLNVTGGEPTVRDDLPILLQRIKEHNIACTLSTNGFALNRKKIKKIKPYLNNIRFSLHGLEETNDYVFQKKGAYQQIMKQIEVSIEEGLSTGVIFSVMKQNIDQLPELLKIIEKKGVSKLIIFTLMSTGRGMDIYQDQLVTAPQVNKYLLELKQKEENRDFDIDINLVDWRLEGQCVLVDPTGEVFGYDPTTPSTILSLGNVLEEKVNQLWDKYPYKKNYINYYRSH